MYTVTVNGKPTGDKYDAYPVVQVDKMHTFKRGDVCMRRAYNLDCGLVLLVSVDEGGAWYTVLDDNTHGERGDLYKCNLNLLTFVREAVNSGRIGW